MNSSPNRSKKMLIAIALVVLAFLLLGFFLYIANRPTDDLDDDLYVVHKTAITSLTPDSRLIGLDITMPTDSTPGHLSFGIGSTSERFEGRQVELDIGESTVIEDFGTITLVDVRANDGTSAVFSDKPVAIIRFEPDSNSQQETLKKQL
ncbi:hypothetical protein [Mobiluncus porci]|uniref:Uncharacterized protein n=1 Tax=Mobiluncus porci TaxID=2652278 RepID=A0A7K0K0M0_9ACTO|nr:hypothetical protein [Mobiluncus porci]MST48969.1 hypothetical protein [Mobiluncus porci]